MNESENRRPLVGITSYGRDDKNRFHLFAQYVDAVRRAGAEVVLLPPGAADIDRWLDAIDGIVLAGGGDIDPGRYGGETHDTGYMVDGERDETEFELTRRVLATDIPTLAICRGAQVLNVVLGGSLHAHLPDVYGETIHHRLPPREPCSHEISLEKDSELAKLMGVTNFSAVSWHHQAIDRPGHGLNVVARAPDEVIEAVEKPDHHWLFAVQWHPEMNAAEEPLQQRLFDEHVKATMRRTR